MDFSQDASEIVQRIRRVVRTARRAQVILVRLGAFCRADRGLARFHFYRNGLTELVEKRCGPPTLMPGRDLLILDTADSRTLLDDIHALLRDQEVGSPEDLPAIVERFSLPGDYARLRQAIEAYVRCDRSAGQEPDVEEQAIGREPPGHRETRDGGGRLARPAAGLEAPPADRTATVGAEALADPGRSLVSGQPGRRLRGRLDAATLAPLLDLIDGIEIRQSLRNRPVWRSGASFERLYTRITADLDAIAQLHFPDLSIEPGEPLALEVARHVDRLVLAHLLIEKPFRTARIAVNLAACALSLEEFVRFSRSIDTKLCGNVVIELHWREYLRDATEGSKLLDHVRAKGFALVVGGIELDLFTFLRPERFEADHIKIAFRPRNIRTLADPDTARSLQRLPMTRVILADCDHPAALTLGRDLGIAHFEGALVDRLASSARSASNPTAKPATRTPTADKRRAGVSVRGS